MSQTRTWSAFESVANIAIGYGVALASQLFPPFSVLSARDGDWQERKRAWLLTGIRSELGRGGDMQKTGANSASGGNGFAGNRELREGQKARHAAGRPIDLVHSAADMARVGYRTSEQAGAMSGRGLTCDTGNDLDGYRHKEKAATDGGLTFSGFSAEFGARGTASAASSTSVFDPVLCELAYRWFSGPDAAVLDPFAGGSVRGVVASALGRRYTGVDLRSEQITANIEQADLCAGPIPSWIAGDSRNLPSLLPAGYRADFVFTCPPYADLERYSDDPLDLSTLAYPDFLKAYAVIIGHCAALLQPDSFACFVVGDVRGKDGNYYGFPSDTAAAFKAAGMSLYNEAILVTSVGSLPVRINGQFNGGRKLGKTHQNVLVFLKGNAKKAAAKCGEITQAESGAKGFE